MDTAEQPSHPASASTPSDAPLSNSSSNPSSLPSSSLPSVPPTPLPSLAAQVLLQSLTSACRLLLSGAECVGESVADFLGITASRYQYVIDVKEREERRARMEEEEEAAARREAEQRMLGQQLLHSQQLEEGARAGTDASQRNESGQRPERESDAPST